MNDVSVEELQRQATRFEEETSKLARYLDELTTDGAGFLYDLKMTVGAESDLGVTISALGGAVRNASANAVNSLNQAKEIIVQKCTEISNVLEEATNAYQQQVNEIAKIKFY
ncbi:MAG: hypothetical protein PUB18_00140 [bacterium]|nr:hypothetical protein [bacterium]